MSIREDGQLSTHGHRKENSNQREIGQYYYKQIVNHAGDIIYCCDEEGICEYISPSVEPSLGYVPEELLGRRHTELCHPDDREMLRGGAESSCALSIKMENTYGSNSILPGWAPGKGWRSRSFSPSAATFQNGNTSGRFCLKRCAPR